MTRYLTTLAAALLAGASGALASPGDHQWSDGWGVNGAGTDTDAAGRPSTAGTFWGTADFGGGALTTASGAIYVAKLDADGGHVWSRAFENPSYATVSAVAASPDGDTYVAGNLSKGGSIDFGDGVVLSGDFGEAWAVRFDGSGNLMWGDTYGRGWIRDLDATDTELGFAGQTTGTMNFGGADLGATISRQIFAAKLTEDQAHVWSNEYGDDASQSGLRCGLTSDGSLVLLSAVNSQADFGGGALGADSGEDIALAMFGPSGGHLWSRIDHGTFGAFGSIYNSGLDVSGSGAIVVSGEFTGTIDLGGGPLTSAGSTDLFVTRVDVSGNHVWSRRFGGVSGEAGTGAAFDSDYNVYVTGTYDAAVDFGTGGLPHEGSLDAFLLALDSGGALLWSTGFGSTGYDYQVDVCASGSGAVTIGLGGGSSGIDFGGGSRTGTYYIATFEGEESMLATPWTPISAAVPLAASPNPFRAGTVFRLGVDTVLDAGGPGAGAVSLDIVDVAGRRVRHYSALTPQALQSGVSWDGRDDLGHDVARGIYYVRARVGDATLRTQVARIR